MPARTCTYIFGAFTYLKFADNFCFKSPGSRSSFGEEPLACVHFDSGYKGRIHLPAVLGEKYNRICFGFTRDQSLDTGVGEIR